MLKKKIDKCDAEFDENKKQICKEKRKIASKSFNQILYTRNAINTIENTNKLLHDNDKLKLMKENLSEKQLQYLTDVTKKLTDFDSIDEIIEANRKIKAKQKNKNK